MKKLCFILAMVVLTPVLAYAQSSGSFSYSTTGNNFVGCTLSNNGAISGGYQCQSSCTIDSSGVSTCTPQSGECMGTAVAGIKTNSGNGNLFVVRPSAVVGLLTDVTVSSKQQGSTIGGVSSSALAGVDFQVSVTGPGNPTVIPSAPVTYDSRYIQISTNLFQALSTQCLAITGGCFITFNESTVSAHSFDFVVTGLQAGDYGLEAGWTSSLGDFGIANSMTCVGPMNLTVEQNKIFQPSTGISF